MEHQVTLAQLVERKTFNLVVGGSSPSCDTNAGLAQVALLRVGKPRLFTWGRGQSAGLLIRRFVVRVHGSALKSFSLYGEAIG